MPICAYQAIALQRYFPQANQVSKLPAHDEPLESVITDNLAERANQKGREATAARLRAPLIQLLYCYPLAHKLAKLLRYLSAVFQSPIPSVLNGCAEVFPDGFIEGQF